MESHEYQEVYEDDSVYTRPIYICASENANMSVSVCDQERTFLSLDWVSAY